MVTVSVSVTIKEIAAEVKKMAKSLRLTCAINVALLLLSSFDDEIETPRDFSCTTESGCFSISGAIRRILLLLSANKNENYKYYNERKLVEQLGKVAKLTREFSWV